MTKKIIGIYLITNLTNGSMYIGQSTDIHKRWSQEKKGNEDSYLTRAIKKHGVENFTFEILMECPAASMNFFEMAFISGYNTFHDKLHYNLTEGGGGSIGRPTSEYASMRISESNRTRVVSDDTRRKISELHKGAVRPPGTGEKISAANIGMPVSEEGRANMSKGQTGRKHSPEHIEKRRQKLLGNQYTLGFHHSPETKQKMSESRKGKKLGKRSTPVSEETKAKRAATRALNKAKKLLDLATETPE
jgi:group I intron endonuclease